MRVFLDTNVLVSAFATRGLCADVFRHIVAEHSPVTGEVVLKELRRVLRTRIKLPISLDDAIEDFLHEHEVVPKPDRAVDVVVRDPDDQWVLASALSAKVDVLVTGDPDLIDLGPTVPLRILDPRGFRDLVLERWFPPNLGVIDDSVRLALAGARRCQACGLDGPHPP